MKNLHSLASAQRLRVTLVLRSPSSVTQGMAEPRDSDRLHDHDGDADAVIGGRARCSPDDLERVRAFAAEHDLEEQAVYPAGRSVILEASASSIERAFGRDGTGLRSRRAGDSVQPGRPRIPRRLADIVTAVHGGGPRAVRKGLPRHGHGLAAEPVDPRVVAKAYRFPSATGRGQRIGIILLGGGFHRADVDAYFTKWGVDPPRLTVVSVAGQKNEPAPPEEVRRLIGLMGLAEAQPGPDPPDDYDRAIWTVEATMDIELAGLLARDAEIVVYFTSNSAQGIHEAFLRALHERPRLTALSCSWGRPEAEQLRSDSAWLQTIDDLLKQNFDRGYVTVTAASGDQRTPTMFPASSPWVLACGGTHAVLHRGGRIRERLWHERLQVPRGGRHNRVVRALLADVQSLHSGGGSSAAWPMPEWQTAVGVNRRLRRRGRGVPDVAAKADVAEGYATLVGGLWIPMGGTSAAAPVWASLVALASEQVGGPVGQLPQRLYSPQFRRATRKVDSDSSSSAVPGRWQPFTGLGSPVGEHLVAALRAAALPLRRKSRRTDRG